MHDGAALIYGHTLVKACVVLPLTEQSAVPAHFGTRHRAAMGITERSDASALVVSEQRGEVTFMADSRSLLVESEQELVALLSEAHTTAQPDFPQRFRNWLFPDWKLKAGALTASVLILAGALLLSGNSERVISVPIEFDNLASNLDATSEGDPFVQILIRGRSWIMRDVDLLNMAVHLDLRGKTPGTQRIAVENSALEMPPGVRAIRVVPDTLAVRIKARRP